MDVETERRRLRFLGKIKEVNGGCWEWQCGKIYRPYGKPYGMFYWGVVEGKELNMQAHRAAWTLLRGLIPEGGNILHKCNNPPCCNPDHLYIGTHLENARDREVAWHTSKWDHRYNFKRNAELLTKIKDLLPTGKSLAIIAKELGIGLQTIYRCRDQDPELRDMIKATKTLRYSNANRVPGRKRRGQT